MKKRHKISLGILVFLILWTLGWNILPVGSGEWNAKQIQKINSLPKRENFCFAVMGDNKNGFGTFHKIIKDINKRRPLFAIDIGDLVFESDKEEYRIFYNEIKKSKVPFLVAIGNHELRDEGRDLYFDIFGNFYYSFSYDNSLFIVLDDANEEYIDKQQMEFLENELKRDFRYKFIFMHVPPFDPREYVLDIPEIVHKDIKPEHCLSNKENARQFMDLASKYKVSAVFSSHIHGYFREEREGVPYIITGGAGASMWLSNPEHYFYHYLNVCPGNNNVNYEIVKFPSPDANILDRFGYAVWLYVWYFIVIHRIAIVLSIIILALSLDLAYGQIKKWQKKIKYKLKL
jgi:3',5'-cyclic AMP phosphodiesterase CpdA